jgi:hypothetical protein
MPIIHLVDGEKGGVGKSLFALCLIHYFDVKGIERHLVDADPRIPDVASVHEGITDIHFQTIDRVSLIHSQQVQKLDCLFELALEKPVIVNLPGNVHDAAKNWILGSDLLLEESITETKVSFCKWFLSDGSDTSIDLFTKSLEDYEGKLPHILVVNQGLNPYWSKAEENDRLKELAQKYPYQAIDFFGLALAERNYLKQNNLSFSKAFEDKKLSILGRQRLVKFLRNTISEIDLVFSKNDLSFAIETKETASSQKEVETSVSDSAKRSTKGKQAKNATTEIVEDKTVVTVESA